MSGGSSFPSPRDSPPRPVNHFSQLIVGTLVALLPLINPLASAPTFLTLTEACSPAERRRQLRRACVYMVGILVSFLIGGTFIMGFFGISIPGLRIAGGLILAAIGARMLFESSLAPASGAAAEAAARAPRDVAFAPLAVPMMSGPGSIAATIGFTSLAKAWSDYVAIILGIGVVAVITYVTLALSERVVRALGANAMNAISRIMAFFILCIGIQFVVNGTVAVLTDPAVVRALHATSA